MLWSGNPHAIAIFRGGASLVCVDYTPNPYPQTSHTGKPSLGLSNRFLPPEAFYQIVGARVLVGKRVAHDEGKTFHGNTTSFCRCTGDTQTCADRQNHAST